MIRPALPVPFVLLAFVLLAGAAVVGCGRADDTGPDPTNPGALAPCPAGHYTLALRASHYEAEPAIVRFDASLRACQGVRFVELGSPRAVGGLPSGDDLVGFAPGYGGSGQLVRVAGTTVEVIASDEALFPISIAPLTWQGTPAVAVLWGDGELGREEGERIDIYAEAGLSLLGSWTGFGYPYVTAVGPAVSGQTARVAGIYGGDLQEYRSDPGADTLATTDELIVQRPSWSGTVGSLDVRGDRVIAGGSNGVLYWRRGMPEAFLGPLRCRWPYHVGTPLVGDDASYGEVAIDATDPEATLVLVNGALDGGSSRDDHLYRLHPRGECEHVYTVPDTHGAVSLGWAGPR